VEIPSSFDELSEMLENGTLSKAVFSRLIKLHWDESSDELDKCSFCQGEDIWEVLIHEDFLPFIEVELMEWLESRTDWTYLFSQLCSEVQGAPADWMERMFPEYWPENWDIDIVDDQVTKSRFETWLKNPNCTSEILNSYIENVHDVRAQGLSLEMDSEITCEKSDDSKNCKSCRKLRDQYL
jgi:hypothetical protein